MKTITNLITAVEQLIKNADHHSLSEDNVKSLEEVLTKLKTLEGYELAKDVVDVSLDIANIIQLIFEIFYGST